MPLELPKALAIPLQVMDNYLKIKGELVKTERQPFLSEMVLYHEQNPVLMETTVSSYHLGFWIKYIQSINPQVNGLDIARGYFLSLQYVIPMDRWKKKYDGLSNQLKLSAAIQHISTHLTTTIVNAKTEFQRNEAVGLALAKVEMVDKILPTRPILAVSGVLSYIESLDFQQLLGQALADKMSYYLCFDYSSLLSWNGQWFLRYSPFSATNHRYYYSQGYGFELNKHCYHALLIVLEKEEDYAVFQQVYQKHPIKAPYLVIQKGDVQHSPYQFCEQVAQWIEMME